MIITKRSLLTGKTHEMDLPITAEQLKVWQDGMLIQNAMPHLTPIQREFLISGSTEEEWKEAFGADDDVEEDEYED